MSHQRELKMAHEDEDFISLNGVFRREHNILPNRLYRTKDGIRNPCAFIECERSSNGSHFAVSYGAIALQEDYKHKYPRIYMRLVEQGDRAAFVNQETLGNLISLLKSANWIEPTIPGYAKYTWMDEKFELFQAREKPASNM